MSVIELNSDNFASEVLEHKGVVIVDFFATWCGPCKMLAPEYEKASAQLADKVKFVKVDIDNCQEIAANYQIMTVPTLLIFKDGEIVETLVGFSPAGSIASSLDIYL